MSLGPEQYDIYRLSEITEDTAVLHIASSMKEFAIRILDELSLPKGIDVDSLSIDPNILHFGTEERVVLSE